MDTANQPKRNFELRSEKTRSLVGEIPSALTRYGIVIIGLVLLMLGGLAYYLPYKKLYTGTAIIKPIHIDVASDSIDVTILLRFDGQRLYEARRQPIQLSNGNASMEAVLLSVSAIRDTLERQEARLRATSEEVKQLENQAVDFRITETSGNILSMMLKTNASHSETVARSSK